ncbi:MAG: hypothetical protein A3J97_06245 [Spirochaetes bacterium RIFOXYC1_FULL_54_7]|nr:MAG: hypothetical protein A3J97_06245 [Spirochaetes bacterium RIFOXYC1_FULL_54_7]
MWIYKTLLRELWYVTKSTAPLQQELRCRYSILGSWHSRMKLFEYKEFLAVSPHSNLIKFCTCVIFWAMDKRAALTAHTSPTRPASFYFYFYTSYKY